MRLHVGNLAREITNTELNTLASEYGNPVSTTVVTDRTSGSSKGFGFIEFSTADEARAAITGLDGREVNGQSIKVSEARARNTAPPQS